MSYCLNPNCQKPLNSEETISCHSCGTKLQPLLRNRYRIIRPLGGGGFGRTFLAEDEDKLNELCVVKQLVPQIQGTKARQKATLLFHEEARRGYDAAACLYHDQALIPVKTLDFWGGINVTLGLKIKTTQLDIILILGF